MESRRLSRAVEQWKSYLDKSPIYRQTTGDRRPPVSGKKTETYDLADYSGPQQQLVFPHLTANIDDFNGTAMEIGAGPGTFTLSLAGRFKHMTVIEPIPSMLTELEKRLAEHHITHVNIVKKRWEDVTVEPHEYVFALGCLHAFYHIDEVLLKMLRASKKRLILLHLSGNGLLDIDYRVANAFKLPPPCYFPPAPLLTNILSSMSLNFSVRVFQVPVQRKWLLPEFVRRYRKMFLLPEVDAGLLEHTLRKDLEYYHGFFRIHTRLGFSVIDIVVG